MTLQVSVIWIQYLLVIGKNELPARFNNYVVAKFDVKNVCCSDYARSSELFHITALSSGNIGAIRSMHYVEHVYFSSFLFYLV